jgi:hypothetical protein
MYVNITDYSVLTSDIRRNPSILEGIQQRAKRQDQFARVTCSERGAVTTVTVKTVTEVPA